MNFTEGITTKGVLSRIGLPRVKVQGARIESDQLVRRKLHNAKTPNNEERPGRVETMIAEAPAGHLN